MAKQHRTLYLPPEVWAQVDDLDGYFGDGHGEIITHILRVWFANNQQEITDTKARIDALMGERPKLSKQNRADSQKDVK